jgi:hypothetical protein
LEKSKEGCWRKEGGKNGVGGKKGVEEKKERRVSEENKERYGFCEFCFAVFSNCYQYSNFQNTMEVVVIHSFFVYCSCLLRTLYTGICIVGGELEN